MALEPDLTTDVIRRSMAIKANVVSQDEKETKGIRVLLNYGHTIGHGLEAATEYGQFLHGEAVAIGMMGAAKIGVEIAVTPDYIVERQAKVFQKFELPMDCPNIRQSMSLLRRSMPLTARPQSEFPERTSLGLPQVTTSFTSAPVSNLNIDMA